MIGSVCVAARASYGNEGVYFQLTFDHPLKINK